MIYIFTAIRDSLFWGFRFFGIRGEPSRSAAPAAECRVEKVRPGF